MPGNQHWYDTNVNAADGRLLFTADWTHNETIADCADEFLGRHDHAALPAPPSHNARREPQLDNGRGIHRFV